jgi:hypothetical protein
MREMKKAGRNPAKMQDVVYFQGLPATALENPVAGSKDEYSSTFDRSVVDRVVLPHRRSI